MYLESMTALRSCRSGGGPSRCSAVLWITSPSKRCTSWLSRCSSRECTWIPKMPWRCLSCTSRTQFYTSTTARKSKPTVDCSLPLSLLYEQGTAQTSRKWQAAVAPHDCPSVHSRSAHECPVCPASASPVSARQRFGQAQGQESQSLDV